MLDVHALKAEDLQGLDASAIAAVAAKMLAHIGEQASRIDNQAREIERKNAELEFKTAKLDKITFELARLKAWKYGAKTEAMSAEQRRLFEETLAEDEAALEAQQRALQSDAAPASSPERRKPRRQALPEHLPRVEHRHEPDDTTCTCGQPMQRVGEDSSERLDIVPAQFFVHRHIYGKWACKGCQVLVQEPVAPQIVDRGMPTAGLVAKFFGPANMATLFGIVMLSHQVGGFLGAWLGGLLFERTGSYDWLWTIDIMLAVGAALIHMPIKEAPKLRPAFAT